MVFRQRNHLVGTARRTTNSKAAVTFGHDAPSNRMENLVEYFVPDALGSRVLNQRECIVDDAPLPSG